ncbi:MAG: AAA family ATPase [Patescibacteria group bacterium]|jgi:archaellum biogenesis ATPase FlaH
MENKSLNIDIKQFCEYLLETTDRSSWEDDVIQKLKMVNSTNTNKLKQKELKTIYRNALREAKEKTNKNQDYQKQVLPISQVINWKGGGQKWIIDQLLPQNGITILSGDPANFKTWSTLHFAICITGEMPVYGYFETIRSNVLIIDEEDGIGLLQERLKTLSANSHSKIFFMIMSGFKIQQEERLNDLINNIKKYKIKVIIIDSLVRIHDGDENSSNDIKKVFEVCRKLNTMGVTVLINHHHRKNSGANYGSTSDLMRGSSDILASIDCHMQIKHKDNRLTITQTKNRISQELKPFTINVRKEDNKIFFDYSGENNISVDKSNKNKESIMKIISEKIDWVSRDEIEISLNGSIGKNAIGLCLFELISDGFIIYKTSGKGKKLYKNKNSPAF